MNREELIQLEKDLEAVIMKMTSDRFQRIMFHSLGYGKQFSMEVVNDLDNIRGKIKKFLHMTEISITTPLSTKSAEQLLEVTEQVKRNYHINKTEDSLFIANKGMEVRQVMTPKTNLTNEEVKRVNEILEEATKKNKGACPVIEPESFELHSVAFVENPVNPAARFELTVEETKEAIKKHGPLKRNNR